MSYKLKPNLGGTLSNNGDRDELAELLDVLLPPAVRPTVGSDPEHRPRNILLFQGSCLLFLWEKIKVSIAFNKRMIR